jgi:hypothetical protein
MRFCANAADEGALRQHVRALLRNVDRAGDLFGREVGILARALERG